VKRLIGEVEVEPLKVAVSPTELATLYKCLSSKICIRIFNILSLERRPLNISAICRRAGCTNGDGVKHLRTLAKIGVVDEEFWSGLHIFKVKDGDLTELLKQTLTVLAEMEGDASSRQSGKNVPLKISGGFKNG
jgi:hypothetical protein